VDEVFKALADPTWRSLLDELFREDGQTLNALAERFSMTRFGVMKHLKQLEEAGLVVTRRRGREKLEKVFEIYIRTTPERLWEAITDGEIRSKYNFGSRVSSDWTPGSRLEMSHPNTDGVLGEGEIIEVDPPRRLVHSMLALWSDEVKNEGTSRVTWEIEPIGDSCRLTVTHDELREGANDELYGGWPMILSGLKTWIETGESLRTQGSLMYG
jgi:uncharacterized protein YndB with AHSA1/START domain